VTALGEAPRRVLVTLGRKELAPFLRAPQHHYLIRSVDPVNPPLALPHADYVVARGPFDEAAERALMTKERIAVVVSKNSGGPASYGKIAAARALGLPIVMLRRPALPDAPGVETIDDVLAWLDHAVTSVAPRGV
jgi:precorrin-6A/cobalt-precorrin-6A reductase